MAALLYRGIPITSIVTTRKIRIFGHILKDERTTLVNENADGFIEDDYVPTQD